MGRITSTAWLGLVTFLSIGVAVYSLRLAGIAANMWIGIDAGIEAMGRQFPWALLAHGVIAATALGAGAFQFYPGMRARHPGAHRLSGRIYVASCVIAGVAALVLALHASGGPIASVGFGLLGVVWIATTLGAWRAAMMKNFKLHRALMLYSFAMTFGAVTLRLQIPLGFIYFGFHSYTDMSRWLAYTAWLPNVALVWLYLTIRDARRAPPATRAA